jgi:DNA-binding transcriptional MocR family regulator
VAALAARGPALQRIRAQRAAEDFFVARPMQEVAVELLGSPAFGRHLRQLHRALRVRRAVLLEALAAQLPQVEVTGVPAGGLHLWVRLPAGVDSTDLARQAGAAGVAVGDGASFYCATPRRDRLRLSFGAGDEQHLRDGVARLAAVLAAAMGSTALR